MTSNILLWQVLMRKNSTHKIYMKFAEIIEESLEVKLPTIWTDEKAEVERIREEKKKEYQRRKSEKRRCRHARKGRKVAIHSVLPMSCGSGGSKSRLAKAAGAEPSGQMRDEKLHVVVARSTCQCQKHNYRSTFGSWDVEKAHAVVARSACRSEKCKNWWSQTAFWKLSCWKRKKTHQVRSTFGGGDVQKVHAVAVRSTFPSQNGKNTKCSNHFWTFTTRPQQLQLQVQLPLQTQLPVPYTTTTKTTTDTKTTTTLRYTTQITLQLQL